MAESPLDDPSISYAILVLKRISPVVAAPAQSAIKSLWGDSEALRNAQAAWNRASQSIQNQITTPLKDDVGKIGTEQWSGPAKDAYTTWIGNLTDRALAPLQTRLASVATVLGDAANAVDDIRWNLRNLCVSFVIGIGGIVTSETPVGWAALAGAAWKLIDSISGLYHDATVTFNKIARSFHDVISPLGTDVMVNVPGIFSPVSEKQLAPLPVGVLGDWGNWGTSNPVPGS